MLADLSALACWKCEALLSPAPANTVDHDRPHRGDPALIWDPANLRAMNGAHHSAKTIGEVIHQR